LPATGILAAPVTQVDQWGLTKREKATYGDARDVPQRGEDGGSRADGARLRTLFDHGVIIAYLAAKIASPPTDGGNTDGETARVDLNIILAMKFVL
jgi:hypothetical protein